MLKEITVDGKTYVDKEELYRLIREHKEKSLAGTEPGFIEKSEKKRMAAYMALNHLQACLVNDEERERMYEKVKKNRENARAIVAITKNDSGKYEMDFFLGWTKLVPDMPDESRRILERLGMKEGEMEPLFTDDAEWALKFADPEMAQTQAEKIRENYEEGDVVRAVAYSLTQTERGRNLLMAILANDQEEDEEEEEK